MKPHRNNTGTENESVITQLCLSKRLRICWFTAGLLAAMAGNALSADVNFIAVVKGQRFEQTGPDLVTLKTEDKPLSFEAFAEGTASDSLVSGTLQMPGGSTVPLEHEGSGDTGIRHEYESGTLLDLNTDRTNGTYTIHLVTKNDGTKNISLTLTGDAYPNVPAVTNFTALQTITNTASTVVRWTSMTGGTTNDFIMFSVYDNDNYEAVYESSGIPGAPGALNGTSVQTTIPENTLLPGRTYEAEILFAKTVAVNTTSYPSALAIAGYYKDVSFKIKTVANGVTPGSIFEFAIPQPWAGDVPRDSAISFRFSHPMNPSYRSVSWTGVSSSNFTYEWLDENKVLLCRYDTSLSADTEIGWSLNLSGFRDARSIPLTGTVDGSFHTSSDDPQSPPDVTWLSMMKMRGYRQTGTNPVSTGMYGCDVSIEMTAYNRVKQGTLTVVANGRNGTLAADEWDPQMRIGAMYASTNDLERFFANGNFTFTLTNLADGVKTVTLSLGTTNDYPAVPTATNLAALQSITSSAPMIISWTAPANWTNALVTGRCLVELGIENSQGEEVLWINASDFISGSQCILPANTLWPGRKYLASLYFIKIKNVNTNSYSGATGVAGFASSTEFTIQTTGAVIMPTVTIHPDGNNNMNLNCSGGEPRRDYVFEASPNLTRWLPQQEMWLGDSQQTNQWYDNDAQYLKQRYYRLRDRLPDESVQRHVTLQGTVWTGSSHTTPVAGAVVGTDLDGQTTVTDQSGSFFLETDTTGDGNYSMTLYTITVINGETHRDFGPFGWGDQPRNQSFEMN